MPLALSGPIWADHVSFRALTGAYHDPTSAEVIGTPPGKVSGRVVVRPDALRFENLAAKLPHTDLRVDVHLGFEDALGVTAVSDNLDLRDTTGLMQKPIAGRGKFRLEVGGTYDDATLTGKLDLVDFVLWDSVIGHLVTRAAMEKDGAAVRFVNTEVQRNTSRYVVDDLLLDFTDQLVVEGRRLRAARASDLYDGFAVAGDPRSRLQGGERAQRALRARDDELGSTPPSMLSAQSLGLGFDGGRIEGTLRWSDVGRGASGVRVDLRELRLAKGRGALVARGEVSAGAALRLTLFGEALRVRDLDVLREHGIALEGELNFVGTARGTGALPEIALSMELVGMQLGNRSLRDGHADVYVTHRADPWVQRMLAADEPDGAPCPRAVRRVARRAGRRLPRGARACARPVICGRCCATR